jgi:PEP-CTERM motif-containing protein
LTVVNESAVINRAEKPPPERIIAMHISKAHAFVICVVFAHCFVFAHPARGGSTFVPLFTQDATQPFPAQDNFEEVLSGNKTGLFTSQSQFLNNAFSNPNPVTATFDSTTNSTIVEFSSSTPIATNTATFYTFGYAINAVTTLPGGPIIINPGNTDGYWTPGLNPPPGHVPEQNVMAQYTPATSSALITISNDPFTFSLSDVGYLVTNTPFALTDLNRTTLPPSAFLPSGVANGTTLTPGMSTSYMISGVDPGQYVTIFSDAQFSGDSSGNPYKGLSGSWLEFQAVPEPSSWVLLAIGSVALLGRVAMGRRFA